MLAAMAALAALSAASVSQAQAETARPPAPEFFGVGAQNLNQFSWALADPRLQAHADQIGALGIRAVRVNQSWDSAQYHHPSHPYNWSTNDRLFGALAQAGIRADVDLELAPQWASEDPHCVGGRAPRAEQIPNFAAFAHAFAKRYGRGGEFWRFYSWLPYRPVLRYEIWNEPNLKRFWCPRPQPKRYAELAVQTAEAIRAADPQATIVFGGLAFPKTTPRARIAAEQFVRRALRHRPELRRLIDEIGIHPYAPTAEDSLALIAEMRQRMRALRFDKPFAVNEWGWVTNGRRQKVRLSESERARQIARFAGKIWRTDCDVSRATLHTWATPQRNPDDPEDWWGIVNWVTGKLLSSATRYSAQVRSIARGAGKPRRVIELCAPLDTEITTRRRHAGPKRRTIEMRAIGAKRAAFSCRLDGRRWRPCRSPYRLPRLADGRHLLEVKARSHKLGADPTPARLRFRYDSKAPRTTIERLGKRRFLLGARQGDARRFHCRIDSGPWERCKHRLRLRGLGAGVHVLRARAVDRAGNRDRTPAKLRFRLGR